MVVTGTLCWLPPLVSPGVKATNRGMMKLGGLKGNHGAGKSIFIPSGNMGPMLWLCIVTYCSLFMASFVICVLCLMQRMKIWHSFIFTVLYFFKTRKIDTPHANVNQKSYPNQTKLCIYFVYENKKSKLNPTETET